MWKRKCPGISKRKAVTYKRRKKTKIVLLRTFSKKIFLLITVLQPPFQHICIYINTQHNHTHRDIHDTHTYTQIHNTQVHTHTHTHTRHTYSHTYNVGSSCALTMHNHRHRNGHISSDDREQIVARGDRKTEGKTDSRQKRSVAEKRERSRETLQQETRTSRGTGHR